jgi:FdrA protein
LGFANSVAEGSIGVVAAAGSGLQEVTALVDRAGGGISQAIGTGGRDLTDDIGGITMTQGLEMLIADEQTDAIVLVSKPPDPDTMSDLLDDVAASPKPVVVEFVGSDPDPIEAVGATPSTSLADAAAKAIESLPDQSGADVSFTDGIDVFTRPGEGSDVLAAREDPESHRDAVRGLFSGGTLATEAATLLGDDVTDLTTNIGLGSPVEDALHPQGNAIIDLGADEFTRNRPHPMIDSSIRDDQLGQTLGDEEVLVVLLDVILGHGAHEDPAQPVADVIEAQRAGDWPVVVASVVGTRGDPQDWASQVETLSEAGMLVGESNAAAVELTRQIYGAVQPTGGHH